MTRRNLRILTRLLAVSAVGLGAVFGVATPAHADTVIATEYEHAGWAGASFNVTVSTNGFTCTATLNDVDVGNPWVGSAWNDRISSFIVYSRCLADHFEHANYGGAHTGYLVGQYNLGPAWNDRASSIKYS